MANRDSFDDFDSDDDEDGFLTFDAREEEEDRSRGPLIIAAVVAALAICGLILWQLYKGGRDAGSPPQIAAETNSFKAAPADPGGEVTADLDKGVYDAADGTTAPPLDVMPKALEEDPLLADGGAIPAKPATAPTKATVPPPVVTPKPAPKPASTQTTPAKAPATQIAQATPAVAKPKPVEVAAAAPKTVLASKAAPAPAPAPSASAPAPTPPPPAKAAAPAASTGISAQLGSFQDRGAAETALAKYRASGLSGPVSVVAADLGAKGIWYRIRATGFDTRSEADSFCAKARSAGAQCIPTGR